MQMGARYVPLPYADAASLSRTVQAAPVSRPQDRLPADWPNRAASRFVRAAGLVWHVQVMGSGPVLLLLHGTGAATHSWRDLMPLLAAHFTVVAPDLPGHGFTEAPACPPAVAAGHGEGAAVAAVGAGHEAGGGGGPLGGCRGRVAHGAGPVRSQPRLVVGLNAALMPMGRRAGQVVLPAGQVPGGRARRAAAVRLARAGRAPWCGKLLADTGSRLDRRGVALYARVVREPSHAASALAMMAHWDLRPAGAGPARPGCRRCC